MAELDVVVVGAGPNGLAAALILAAAGLSVQVVEAAATAGGGCRTEELTLPGSRHDVCSAVHALGEASPFFEWFGLADRGVRLLQPEVCFAHPLDGGRAGAVRRSLDETATGLGSEHDARAWRRTFAPLLDRVHAIIPATLGPLRPMPRQPLRAARFASVATRSIMSIARRFDGEPAKALLAGVGAHTMRPLDKLPTGGFGALMTLLAHSAGWPVVEGGSQLIVDAMVQTLQTAGGRLETGHCVTSLDELPSARAVLLDLAPEQVVRIAGDRLPRRHCVQLSRYRYGPGVCKVDWTLSGPVPWVAEACRRAATVHVGGRMEEVAAAEADVAAGRHPDRPFTLVVQPGIVDPTRAPAGRQTLWAYCHVPAYSTVDMADRIEQQIERFAPGFRDLIMARSVMTAVDEQRVHPTYIGGDINVGAASLRQLLFRPTVRWNNYTTPNPSIFLCGSATPPGGGVHGMCGMHAARTVLRRVFDIQELPQAPAPQLRRPQRASVDATWPPVVA